MGKYTAVGWAVVGIMAVNMIEWAWRDASTMPAEQPAPESAAPPPTALVITNRGGGLACFTREDLTEAIHAAIADNPGWILSMVESGACVWMPTGLPATLKAFGWEGVSEIYLHLPTRPRPLVVWTANENFARARSERRSGPQNSTIPRPNYGRILTASRGLSHRKNSDKCLCFDGRFR